MALKRSVSAFWAPALLTLSTWSSLASQPIDLDIQLAKPVLLAGKQQTTFLKVGLTGRPAPSVPHRPPVNVAIVVDRSGSMSGEKIVKATDATIQAINDLSADDRVSVVTYNDGVDVHIPSTKVTDIRPVTTTLASLSATGGTALFAGVSKGANEIRKFASRNHVNRVILLSDGQANVGPHTPAELAQLGQSLFKEGIAVSTIGLGLGYNEDLMTELARSSDGNHVFAETANDLAKAFDNELRTLLSVIAQGVDITIECTDGVRPIRLLGRTGDITGNRVTVAMNQLYTGQQKYVLLEIDISPGAHETERDVAVVTVNYANMKTQTIGTHQHHVSVRFLATDDAVQLASNRAVAEAAILQIANENDRITVQLRDEGKIEEAAQNAWMNVLFIDGYVQSLKSNVSTELSRMRANQDYNAQPGNLSDDKWQLRRKQMRTYQHEVSRQQLYTPPDK